MKPTVIVTHSLNPINQRLLNVGESFSTRIAMHSFALYVFGFMWISYDAAKQPVNNQIRETVGL